MIVILDKLVALHGTFAVTSTKLSVSAWRKLDNYRSSVSLRVTVFSFEENQYYGSRESRETCNRSCVQCE